jgi:hypothetical protein
MRERFCILVWTLAPLFAYTSGYGQGLQRGDVLVSVARSIDPFTSVSSILVYAPNGSFRRTLISDTPGVYNDTVVDRSGIVWAALNTGVQTISTTGTALAFYSLGRPIIRLTPTADGRLLASDDQAVFVIGPNGSTLGFVDFAYQLGGAGTAIDLAPDQCTLYYGLSSGFRRYDLCHNQLLPVFSTVPDYPQAVRLLPDGSILVANTNVVSRISALGTVMRTYPVGAFQVALDVDGTSFWTARGTFLYKVDIESGQVLVGPVDVGSFIMAIGIVGEPRVATSPAAIAAIPALSPAVLFLLLVSLAAIAIVRLTR